MGYRYLEIIEVGLRLWQNTQYLNLGVKAPGWQSAKAQKYISVF